jgi:hypothetical protein
LSASRAAIKAIIDWPRRGDELQILRSITFVYNTAEDRILAAVNPGSAEAWSCWLTRRLSLALLENAGKFLASTSTLVQRAAPEARGEVVAFEREAAVAQTAPAMSLTPPQVLKTTVATAELVQRVTLTQQGERIRMEVRGVAGGGADAALARAELQRILQMLQAEVAKAAWLTASAAPAPAPLETMPKPLRH